MTTFFLPKTVYWLAVLPLVLAGCTPNKTKTLLQPPQALGTVLAEETIRAAGAKKQVLIITPDASWGSASTVEEAFRAMLKRQGVAVVVAKAANLGDPMRGRMGLKAADFFEAMEKAGDAGAVVSFVGAPVLAPGEVGRLGAEHPPVLVVSTMVLGTVPGVVSDPQQLANLLAAKVIRLAIVDGADAAGPKAAKTDATHALFEQNYHILRQPD